MLLTGCGKGPQDVTHDPSFGKFGGVVGVWKTKVPLRVVQGTNDLGGDLTLVLSDTSTPGAKDLAVLPIGTEVRIECLYYWETFETSYLVATGSLTAGAFKDRPMELYSRLFAKDLMRIVQFGRGQADVVKTTWTVSADILEK
jgi:hypothetical protein